MNWYLVSLTGTYPVSLDDNPVSLTGFHHWKRPKLGITQTGDETAGWECRVKLWPKWYVRVALRMILWTCRFNNIKENEVVVVLLLLVYLSATFWRDKKPANKSQHDIIMKSDHLLISNYYTEGLSRCTVNLYAQLERGFRSA